MWQSGACFPTDYVSRASMNALYWRCNATAGGTGASPCTASAGSTNLYGATDLRVDTFSASIALAAGQAWLRVPLTSALDLRRVSMRGTYPAAPASDPTAATVRLWIELSSGEAVQAMALNSSSNYQFLGVVGNWAGVVSLLVNGSAAFSVTELAAQYGLCYESATVDLGAVQTVATVRTRYYPGSGAVASWLLASEDGAAWVDLVPAGLNTSRISALTVQLEPPMQARYLAVKHQDVVGVRLESASRFRLTEVAVQVTSCVEWAVVDMGDIKEVGVLRFRFWSPDAIYTNMSVSADGVEWDVIRAFMNSSTLSAVELYLPELIYVRYLRITHQVKENKDWRKVYVWGIDAYDKYGRWGPPPTPSPHPLTLKAMMGVNGIWGWGTNYRTKYNNASRYAPVASWGRNYHGMNWDVRWPTNNPNYTRMAQGKGTDAMWWLNWDQEYAAWKKAGLRVDATFQFLWDVFPPSSWGPNVTATAYMLGFAFGSHFGPGRAPPNVSLDAVEVGNEPWIGYNASFYSALLRGFARGVKDADPTFQVLPCALQAENPFAEDKDNGNFVGARIPPDVAPLIDVLNQHAYSWYRDPEDNNTLLGVHPEHPGSSMNGINNMLAWRDHNMPGTPLWLTEWGWDSRLPGEVCNTTVCVSQFEQAVYAIRGLAILARKQIEVAIWFFYADGDDGSGVFARSGLMGSNSTRFPIKPVYRALRSFLQLAGDCRFLDVVSETPSLYAYLLGPTMPVGPGAYDPDNLAAAATYLLAWRPVAAGEGPDEPTIAARLTLERKPSKAWYINGQDGPPGVSISKVANVSGVSSWTLRVSAVPLLIKLQ
ncbi:hypothetical protein GPECTOR_3g28 [Gonium pectorale]|uniref:F5/8 type C domain-containing protein n=1 Tax=Gonium pectorale TaxID=33097 RepID=A0A150GZT1_GONPE|nr:hypothetical protein GPECTOR_3g28 [Gonium pectorale]|eukprot:KXZ55128.1 hypothetical protein GPECTOR_3g28 [Gonium pectorale]